MSNLSNGNLERKVKGELRARWRLQNAPCAYCHGAIEYSAPANHPLSLDAAHRYPVKTHPHLAYDPNNYVPSHARCNRSAQDEVFQPIRWVEANWG